MYLSHRMANDTEEAMVRILYITMDVWDSSPPLGTWWLVKVSWDLVIKKPNLRANEAYMKIEIKPYYL